MINPEIFLTADDAARIINCDAQNIRSQAQADPSKLGFNVVVIGRRVLIPKIPFFDYLGIKSVDV